MELETFKDLRILLVDDDEDDYLIVKATFNRIPDSPFILEWCSTYEEALVLIAQGTYDAFLIDYRLGAHTGLELLQQAEPEKRSEPFIFLTGASDQQTELRSMRLAAADYLVKGTFDAHSLSRTILYAVQRKRVEQQRLDYLLELNKTKDEFISIASHQLRTPATGVKQYIGMLIEGFVGELTPRQHDMLTRAYESNERQLRIVSDLLKVAQVDAGKVNLHITEVNITELIDEILKDQQSTYINRHQTVRFLKEEQDVSAWIDRDAIRMVLENLVDNASKYSNESTVITVKVKTKQKTVVISVQDQGVGIDPSDQSKLFQKFSRIDNELSSKVDGTGIGLYWAKKVIDLHQGEIVCKSTKGKGTTFEIELTRQSKV